MGRPGVAVPLYALKAPCDDPRYPALAGPFVVGCGPSGLVDRALSLQTGRLLPLPRSARSPALDDGQVYIAGVDGGLIRLTEPAPTLAEDIGTIHDVLVAPPALLGDHVAVLTADRVQAAAVTDHARRLYDAHPVGWYPPAIAGDRVAWIDTGGTDPSAAAVWWMPLGGGRPAPLGAGRHVVGSAHLLAWVTPEALVVWDLDTDQQTARPIRTGFSAPPAVWQDVLCWEAWGEADLDIVCDDGLSVTRPGHQQWPSRFSRWLVFREGGQVWLLTAPDPP